MPQEQAIYLLGLDTENIVATNALNRLFITKMGRVLLNQQADDLDRQPQHFWCLDEFHSLGKLPEFEHFVTRASGKGVSISLAFQALSSLQAVYGREGAETIMGQCFRHSYLRLNDATTAQFASRHIGNGDRFYKAFDGNWILTNKQEKRIPVVPPSEFNRFPAPEKGQPGFLNWLLRRNGTPLRGFYTGNFGFWKNISPEYISKNLMPKADRRTQHC